MSEENKRKRKASRRTPAVVEPEIEIIDQVINVQSKRRGRPPMEPHRHLGSRTKTGKSQKTQMQPPNGLPGTSRGNIPFMEPIPGWIAGPIQEFNPYVMPPPPIVGPPLPSAFTPLNGVGHPPANGS